MSSFYTSAASDIVTTTKLSHHSERSQLSSVNTLSSVQSNIIEEEKDKRNTTEKNSPYPLLLARCIWSQETNPIHKPTPLVEAFFHASNIQFILGEVSKMVSAKYNRSYEIENSISLALYMNQIMKDHLQETDIRIYLPVMNKYVIQHEFETQCANINHLIRWNRQVRHSQIYNMDMGIMNPISTRETKTGELKHYHSRSMNASQLDELNAYTKTRSKSIMF